RPYLRTKGLAMRQVTTALIAMTWLVISVSGSVQAQAAKGGVSVGFRNRTDTGVIVQGYTIVNNVQKRGQTLPVNKSGMAFESNVPSGTRYYTIYDANQPSR